MGGIILTADKIEFLIKESKLMSFANPKKSYKLAEKALYFATSLDLIQLKADSMLHMAYACRVMSDYAKCFTHVYDALDIYENINYKFGIMKAKNMIGITYFYFGSYSEALENFMAALEIIKSYPDPNLESSILNNIGEIYREAKDKDSALQYYNKALEITITNRIDLNSSVIYSNIGDVYLTSGEIEAAKQHLDKAYALALNHTDMINQAEIETKLGRVMFELGDLSASRDYFLSSLMKLNQINNKFYLIDLLIHMAICDQRQGLNPIKYLNEALNHSIDNQLQSKTSQIYKLLADYYEVIQDYKTSLHHFKAYHNKEKEIEAINLSKRLEIISIEFNYYKEKRENDNFKNLTSKLKREITQVNNELEKIKKENISLTKETLIDELTKLYNRRGIEKMFADLSPQSNSDLISCVFLLDIDNFKLYNDYWGHLQGDVCLSMISGALTKIASFGIYAGRYGGEEFLCFTSDIKKRDVAILGEEIRKSIENLKIPYTREKKSGYVTVSIGISAGNIHKYNYHEHFDKADRALYKAKEAGRNCIVLYTD